MDIIIGIVGDGYTLITADSSSASSIVRYQDTEDKIYGLGDDTMTTRQIMACAGPNSDRTMFCEFIERNVKMYSLEAGIPLTTKAVANFTRNTLATALRKGPYQANILLGGFDQGKGPSLYIMDYMGALHPVDKAAHGYGSYFTLGLLDRHYKKNMTLDEGLQLLKQCIAELNTRFILNTPHFIAKIVDKDGVRKIEV